MSRKSPDHSVVTLALLFSALCLPSAVSNAETPLTKSPVCHECIRFRVGLPIIEQGPAGAVADDKFTEIRLPDGRFRGFTAAGETFAIDGSDPSDMRGPMRKILGRGAPGTYDACGQWLQHVELVANTVLGWVHNETACNYSAGGQTHMSESLAFSDDYGLTWKNYGLILTGTDAPTVHKMTGEGGCTAVNGQDGYYYAYCTRPRDRAYIVARAPVSDPRPGNWMKFFQGRWDQPGIGGDATPINESGYAVARWTTTGETLLLGWTTKKDFVLHFSTDHVNFTSLSEPLLALDPGSWNRPAPSELLAYQDLIDAETGTNQLSNSWLMVYMYVQPNERLNKRFLVMRRVDVSITNSPVSPQVGVLLSRWYNPALHDRWSTTAPVPSVNSTTYKLEAKSGYMMTVADSAKPSVELEDCVSQQTGHPDHLLAEKGFCESHKYQRLRTAGWVYSQPQEQTVPLYQCFNEKEFSHFASNEQDCEKLGKMERLLGYAMSK
jgi:hypothetical protein